MIRHMLQRGFLMSSQLYVTWSHTKATLSSMLSAFDETLAILAASPLEASPAMPQQGFARLV
jgi:hypothetical protein